MMRWQVRHRGMDQIARCVVVFIVLSLSLGLTACAHQPLREDELRKITQLTDAWESQSDIHQDLSNLPPPAGLVAVSVFSFRDQSGQYKPAPANAFSTAVSQGGTAMVVEALSDSGWFLTLEREGLQNLLTERKIIRARRGESAVPPLQGANIIIEGGVIGYDSNIKTGGAGAKYLGIGADEKYRVDALTVNLRAVDTANGTVIHTVNVTKTIISHAVTASVFRFVKFKRLLEAEAGVTQNEPAQLILKDAIDTAVIRLILLGLVDGSWQLKDYRDLKDIRLFRYATPVMQEQLMTLHDRVASQMARPPVQSGASASQPRSPKGAPVIQSGNRGAGKSASTRRIPSEKASGNKSSEKKSLGKRAPGKAASPPRLSAKQGNKEAQSAPPVDRSRTANQASAMQDYSIQLAASKELQDLRDLSQQWGLPGNLVRIIRVRGAGKGDQREWYTLQLGSYRSSREAQTALEALPDTLRTFEPWVNQRAQQFQPVGAAGAANAPAQAPAGSAANPLKVQ